jgi:predicted DNA-binding transcriptional regulator AlpA
LGKKAETTLLLALACGASVDAAARQCGLTDRTIYRRLKDPAFRQQIIDVRRDMVNRASDAMSAAAMEAVKTLLELQKPNYPPPVRLGAARSMLEIGAKMREMADIEGQLAEVKELLKGAQANGVSLHYQGPMVHLDSPSGMDESSPPLTDLAMPEGGADGLGQAAADAG